MVLGKTAFLFPGQGAQSIGMGADFYHHCPEAKEVFELASEVTGLDVPKLCFEQKDLLDRTEYTQIALVATELAMERVVRLEGLHPDVAAGLSLGEYSALVSCGAMDAADAFWTVRQRGILMERAFPEGEGAMAAVLGLSDNRIEEVLKSRKDVFVANFNCPGQVAITGTRDAVAEASEALKQAGARRVVPLQVSGPFHSPFMEPASEGLKKVLTGIPFRDPEIPYITNVTAEPVMKCSRIPELLIYQVASSVLWQQSVEEMVREGVESFVEIGPGRTLTGFVRKIAPDAKCFTIRTYEELQKTREIWKGEASC